MRFLTWITLASIGLFSNSAYADTIFYNTLPLQSSNSGYIVNNYLWLSQSVLASTSGNVNTIQVDAEQFSPTTAPFNVKICTDNNGAPSRTCQLFTSPTGPRALQNAPVFATYTGNFAATRGQTFWVVFSSPDTSLHYTMGYTPVTLAPGIFSSDQGLNWSSFGNGIALNFKASGASSNISSVPALNTDGLIFLAFLLALLGFTALRYRKR